MALTPQQVAEKKFTSTRFKNGYDETEVDGFLDEVEAELTRLADEAATLRQQLEHAQSASQPGAGPAGLPGDAPVGGGGGGGGGVGVGAGAGAGEQPKAPSVAAVISGESTPSQGEMEEMLRRTLLLAQRTADEVVAEAKADAARERSAAHAEAEALSRDSTQRAADVERDASTRAAASLADLEADKRRIEAEIATLRTFESDFRGRLRAYLELQLHDLDGAQLYPPADQGPAGRMPAVSATPAAPALTQGQPFASEVDPLDGDDEDGSTPTPRPEATPAVLPELPPLPSWMHADAGFVTPAEDSVTPGNTPDGS